MSTKLEKIITDIETQISNKVLSKGDQLPSLSTIRNTYGVSRDTGIRVYKDLTNRGIANAVHGKGYFLAKSKADIDINLFLLLDELTSYKEVLVRAIAKQLSPNMEYQIFFHHYNPQMFQSLVNEAIGKFTHYAISPFPGSELVRGSLENIPDEQLILLDRHDGQLKKYNFVGQEYELDIYNGLAKMRHLLHKYNRLHFIFPQPSYHPEGLRAGFCKFSKDFELNYKISRKLSIPEIKKGDAYLVINDNDLTEIVKYSNQNKWELGKDIGVVSYNETQLKSVVANGITTISTDFSTMGEQLVEAIEGNLSGSVHNTLRVRLRNSI